MSSVMVLKNSAPPLCMLGLLLPPCSNSLCQSRDQWSECADFYGKKPKVRSLFFFFFTQIDRWVSNINKGGSNGIVDKRWGAWKYFSSLGGTCNQHDRQGYVVLFKSLLKQFSSYNLPQANRKFYIKYGYPALLNFDLHFFWSIQSRHRGFPLRSYHHRYFKKPETTKGLTFNDGLVDEVAFTTLELPTNGVSSLSPSSFWLS